MNDLFEWKKANWDESGYELKYSLFKAEVDRQYDDVGIFKKPIQNAKWSYIVVFMDFGHILEECKNVYLTKEEAMKACEQVIKRNCKQIVLTANLGE